MANHDIILGEAASRIAEHIADELSSIYDVELQAWERYLVAAIDAHLIEEDDFPNLWRTLRRGGAEPWMIVGIFAAAVEAGDVQIDFDGAIMKIGDFNSSSISLSDE